MGKPTHHRPLEHAEVRRLVRAGAKAYDTWDAFLEDNPDVDQTLTGRAQFTQEMLRLFRLVSDRCEEE